jgi:hypothetical protein
VIVVFTVGVRCRLSSVAVVHRRLSSSSFYIVDHRRPPFYIGVYSGGKVRTGLLVK